MKKFKPLQHADFKHAVHQLYTLLAMNQIPPDEKQVALFHAGKLRLGFYVCNGGIRGSIFDSKKLDDLYEKLTLPKVSLPSLTPYIEHIRDRSKAKDDSGLISEIKQAALCMVKAFPVIDYWQDKLDSINFRWATPKDNDVGFADVELFHNEVIIDKDQFYKSVSNHAEPIQILRIINHIISWVVFGQPTSPENIEYWNRFEILKGLSGLPVGPMSYSSDEQKLRVTIHQ